MFVYLWLEAATAIYLFVCSCNWKYPIIFWNEVVSLTIQSNKKKKCIHMKITLWSSKIIIYKDQPFNQPLLPHLKNKNNISIQHREYLQLFQQPSNFCNLQTFQYNISHSNYLQPFTFTTIQLPPPSPPKKKLLLYSTVHISNYFDK